MMAGFFKLVEDLIYQILALVLFIPKTYLMAAQPGKAQAITHLESDKAEEGRYDEYISPILFYISMILFGVIIQISVTGEDSPASYLERFFEISEASLIVSLFGTFLWPLLFAIAIQLLHWIRTRTNFSRSSFRRIFEAQCFHWGVFVSVGPLIILITELIPVLSGQIMSRVLPFIQIPVFSYLAYLETSSVSDELKLPRLWAFLLSLLLVFGITYMVGSSIGDVYSPLFLTER